MKRFFFCFLLFFAIFLYGEVEETEPILFNDLIGADINTIWHLGEIPKEIFPYRQESAADDNVVFYYDNYRYLFLFKGRVWQIRYDSRYPAEFDGLLMGMPVEKVIEIKGPPLFVEEDSLIYQEDDRGYPVQSRLYFEEGVLVDYYLYRSDY